MFRTLVLIQHVSQTLLSVYTKYRRSMRYVKSIYLKLCVYIFGTSYILILPFCVYSVISDMFRPVLSHHQGND